MSGAKFAAGDQVSFLPGPHDNNITRGQYTVVRALPLTSLGYQYRVKSVKDSHERVIDEAQLTGATMS
jgi:hypothetical protein